MKFPWFVLSNVVYVPAIRIGLTENDDQSLLDSTRHGSFLWSLDNFSSQMPKQGE
jgi:hypothetical protein